MRGIIRIPNNELTEILAACDLSYLILTPAEDKRVETLVRILEPFEEITDILQGERYCTISMEAPAVMELDVHLDNCAF